MSQLEAFATFSVPLVQIANLTVGTAAQSVVFNYAPADRNGTTANGSPTITMANTQDIGVGMFIGGTNVPPNSRIVSIVPNTSVTIDQNCTGAATNNMKFATGTTIPIARLRILNLSTNQVAICFSDAARTSVPSIATTTASSTAQAPAYTLQTMAANATATALAATDGIRIPGNGVLEINMSLDTRLWVIASGASSAVQVAAILQNG
jgi:hypothetical protein